MHWCAGAHAAGVKPSQANITDMGLYWMARGWYDAQCQGAALDYCRYVSVDPSQPWNNWGAYFSCALAGSDSQYTPRGMYYEVEVSAAPCSTPTGEAAAASAGPSLHFRASSC